MTYSNNHKIKIGILALQGCVDLHIPHIESCGCEYIRIRNKSDFESADAFIIPGGESTTMLKLLDVLDLYETAKNQFTAKPVWGICAGAILIASSVTNPAQESFALIDMIISRNGYGRQLDSKEFEINETNCLLLSLQGSETKQPARSHSGDCHGASAPRNDDLKSNYAVSFIRAPIIESTGKSTQIHALMQSKPIWVTSGKYMATTFHPETNGEHPSPFHKYFIDMVKENIGT